jgi:hypothetical protein
VRRNGPTEPDRLVWPTRPGPALQPPHAAGARCFAPSAAWTVPESWPAAQGRPASSRQAGHGTTGRRSSGRTRGHGWRIAGRGLVTGGFLLCGWLVTSAGHAAAAETARPAAPHDFVSAASQITGAGSQIVPSLGSFARPAAPVATAADRLARTVTSTAATATSAVTSRPGRPVTSAVMSARPDPARPAPVNAAAPPAAVSSPPAATPLAARPTDPAGVSAAVSTLTSNLTGAIRGAVSSLATPLLQSLGGPATHGLVPGSLHLPSLPSLAARPVASIPGATDVATIVPVGVNPGGPNRPAGNLPGSHPLMRMAPRQASGPARTARPAVTALTLAPVPAAAAQQAASWIGRAPQQYAGARLPAAPHRSAPGGDKLGAGAATQTDPVPAGGGAGATQMAAPLPARSGQPNLAGWLIRMRMSRSPAGLQRADDPAVSPD